ncbi:hypothetical protein V7Z92_27050, partial [Priestia megaterium]
LFPQWTNYKKEVIAETYIGSAGKTETVEPVSGNINISEARKNFQLPGLKYSIRNELIKKTIEKKPFLLKEMKEAVMNETILPASAGVHCRFCPHLDICGEGEYPID